MKTSSKVIRILLSVCLAVCVALPILLLGGNQAKAFDDVPFTLTEIKDEYYVGSSITVPEGKLIYQSNEYDISKSELVYPNGEKNIDKEFTFSNIGAYTLNLYATAIGGTELRASKNINVVKPAYSVSSEQSSYSFEKELEMSNLKNSGIHAKIFDGDTFTYNKVINLKEGENDFISFYHYNKNKHLPGADGTLRQAENMYFRLTDVYDQTNYIEFVLYSCSNGMMYYRAGASNQASVGLNKDDRLTDAVDTLYINNEHYWVFRSDWGTHSQHNGYSHEVLSKPYTLIYNTTTGECFVKDALAKVMVNQLFNKDIQQNVFKGFATGEVILSIKGSNYQMTNYFDLNIESIAGERGNALDIKKVIDDKAPVLNVNTPELDNFVIAKGEEFKLFDAVSYDANSANLVQTKVYYNYGTSYQTSVIVENGKITPTKIGAYTIEYYTVDYYGHETVKTVTLNAVNCANNKVIQFEVEKLNAIYAGKTATLPSYTAQGLNGEVTVETYLQFDNQTIKFENEFVPKQVGEYQIIYKYYDKLASYEYSYKVNCQTSDAILPVGNAKLPKYFIKNAEYTLDKFFVNTFDKAEVGVHQAEIYVSENGGDYKLIGYDKYKITTEGTLRFKYVYGGYTCETDQVKIVDVGFGGALKMDKYFVGNVSATPSYDSITFTANTLEGNETVDFINPIILSKFNFTFSVPSTSAKFSRLVITLADYTNADEKIEINYKNVGGIGYMSVDEGEYKLLGNTTFAGRKRTIKFVENNNSFVDDTGVVFNCDKYFTSGKVLLSFTFENISGATALTVNEINNQTISQTPGDYIEPEFTLSNVNKGVKTINTNVTFSPVYVSDVLSPVLNEKTYLTVKDPTGAVVTSTNGISLNKVFAQLDSYQVKLDKYGTYKYSYVITDAFDNSCYTEEFEIVVMDGVSPTITIKGVTGEPFKVTYNSVHKFNAYEISDNSTAKENLKVIKMIVSPSCEMFAIGDSLIMDRKGSWKVIYYCYDEYGNYATASYEIIVE